jgi:hypothetical protein
MTWTSYYGQDATKHLRNSRVQQAMDIAKDMVKSAWRRQ